MKTLDPDPYLALKADPNLNNRDSIVRGTISGTSPRTNPVVQGTIRITQAAATDLTTEATVSSLLPTTATILPEDAQDPCRAEAHPE
jgi:hypothetical protein